MFKLFLENARTFTAYHQTSIDNAKNIKRRGFSTKKSISGIIWFSSSLEELPESGSNGRGAILELEVTMNNPAGWAEYHKYLLMQLKSMGYDGAILPDGNTFDGFVFNPQQIKVLRIL